jgi:hypothetical protein
MTTSIPDRSDLAATSDGMKRRAATPEPRQGTCVNMCSVHDWTDGKLLDVDCCLSWSRAAS